MENKGFEGFEEGGGYHSIIETKMQTQLRSQYYRKVSYTYTGTGSEERFTFKTESMDTEDRESLSQ